MITKLEHAFTGEYRAVIKVDTNHDWITVTSYDDSDYREHSTELKLGLA